MSIIMLSYLIAFVQLTWQVGFSSVFDDFFMNFIIIGPAYIRAWVGGERFRLGWVVAKAKANKQDDTNSIV